VSAPIAYIRRSVARKGDPGDVSREFQIDKVRALANGDGPTLRILDGDWGRSAAREKTDHRLAFLGLIASVERGEVSTIYAYSSDRLARSVRWAAQLLDACEAAGTTIVTSEGRFAPGDRMARSMFHFQAMQNEGALDGMTEKSSAVAAKRVERGDVMGRAPYGFKHEIINGVSTLVTREGEDPQHVVDAFVAAGSYLEAARALNEDHYPTRFEGKKWDPTTVRNVVKRTAPELVPVRTRRGAKTISTRLFSGLLVCHCGRTLTSMPTKWGVRYYCRVAHFDASHARPYIVAESKVLKWAQAEVARLGKIVGLDYADVQAGATEKIAKFETRRERVLDMYESGDIDKAEKARRLAAIEAEMPAVESVRRIKSITLKGRIDWSGDPAAANGELRNLWRSVQMGPDMLPASAQWNIEPPTDAEIAEAEATADLRRYTAEELKAMGRKGDFA
jgi:DNA invertase Pin-like site-specific DNA recombinase